MMTRGEKAGLTAVACLVAAHLVVSLFVSPPGYLTMDDGMYHLMVRTFSRTGDFIVPNGYNEFPSRELVISLLKTSQGKLASQYPEFFTLAVYPFYRAFGFQGLLLVNALAFLGINLLIFRLGSLLLGSRGLGCLAAGIYTFATFAWEHSQSAIPHLSSTFLLLAGYYAMVLGLREPSGAAALRWFARAGMATGFAMGLRLDSAFVLPGLLVPLLFARPARLKGAAALAAGLAPGLLLLSGLNWLKFDTLNPFSYGREAWGYTSLSWYYLPVVLAGAAATTFALAWRRLSGEQRKRASRLLAAGAVLGAISSLFWFSRLADVARAVLQILVDLRFRDFDALEAHPVLRTARGAVVYFGNVKKALLQSCPYLVALLWPLMQRRRHREDAALVLPLYVVPLTYAAFFSYLAWHGGGVLNMRYFNPVLPFTSLLAAYVLVRLPYRPRTVPGVAFFASALVALFFLFRRVNPLDIQEKIFLDGPLVLATLLLAAMWRAGTQESAKASGKALAYLLLFAMAWSGAVGFSRDYLESARHRAMNWSAAEVMRPLVRDHSIIFTDRADMCWGLLDHVEELRIAEPWRDNYGDFAHLVRFHLDTGRSVYFLFSPAYDWIYSSRHVSGLRIQPIRKLPVPGEPGGALLAEIGRAAVSPEPRTSAHAAVPGASSGVRPAPLAVRHEQGTPGKVRHALP